MVKTVEVPVVGIKFIEVKFGAPEWALDIIKYIDANKLPDNEARKIRNRVVRYPLLEGVLCKRCYSMPFLRCVSFEEAQYMLVDLYEGIYGDHSG